MTWKPRRRDRGALGARCAHLLRKLGNRATLRPISWHGKAPRTYAREAILEAETMIADARRVMRPSLR